MSAISSKLRDSYDNGIAFWCPGCGQAHRIQHGTGSGPRWTWNGDVDKPTFSPSILVRRNKLVLDTEGKWTGEWVTDAAGNPIPLVCHSFVTDGRIRFLGDCTHALAGQTVDLPDFPRNESP